MTGQGGWVLYVREGCHLCEQFLLDLSLDHPALATELATVDVDADARLAALFGLRVPVLASGDEVICEGIYDAPRLATALGL